MHVKCHPVCHISYIVSASTHTLVPVELHSTRWMRCAGSKQQLDGQGATPSTTKHTLQRVDVTLAGTRESVGYSWPSGRQHTPPHPDRPLPQSGTTAVQESVSTRAVTLIDHEPFQQHISTADKRSFELAHVAAITIRYTAAPATSCLWLTTLCQPIRLHRRSGSPADSAAANPCVDWACMLSDCCCTAVLWSTAKQHLCYVQHNWLPLKSHQHVCPTCLLNTSASSLLHSCCMPLLLAPVWPVCSPASGTRHPPCEHNCLCSERQRIKKPTAINTPAKHTHCCCMP